ncbi:GPH family glycoside/pentoside/hexuronide:cation symporter [Anaerosolibacter carboniphilus]|uniref:GPH family glycoside/pentoside/hexuronide:cation symporter n=1 Tax=Anaerosolibacter carboniphilus TaxID=1417629 RepID=A0A841L2E3_9FIRM|nr:MFS transporter [Anaerosolibacter carboniphilus]MBB6217332.1 GPH family glycoside/pentoside/hexuronide:cation symporter [Anaerosolibacter carboniphilus]
MDDKKVPNKIINIYGFADFTFNMMMMIAISYYAYFLTDIAMISAATMGTILLIARIGDAVSVPITGGILQKTQLKWGQFRSWLLVTPPITCLFFILMFTNVSMTGTAKAVFLGTCYVIAHVCVNFTFNGHIGLLGILGKTAEDRIKLSAKKSQFQTAANIVFSLAFMPLVVFFGGTDQGKGFLYAMIIFAILQVLGYWNVFRVTKEYNPYDPNKKLSGAGSMGLTVGEMVQQIFGNSQLLLIMLADCIKNAAMFAVLGMATYYFKYAIGNLALITVYMLVTNSATFLGSLAAPIVVGKIGKKPTYLLSCIIPIVAFVLVRVLAGTNPFIYMALVSISSFALTFGMAIGPAMYLDSAEYGHYKTGKDGSGFIMSMFAMPIKIGVALSSVIIGFGLSSIGYSTTVEVTPNFVSGLMKILSIIPAGCCALALVLMLFYRLNDAKVQEYMEANAKRKATV